VIINVGFWLKFILTSSIDAVHGPLLIVQRSVYAVPATPVKVLVGLAGVATVPPDPNMIVHDPVPTTGILPARVAVVNPHIDAPV
jgi:hypothetical protein